MAATGRSSSASPAAKYLPNQAPASIVVGTVIEILLKLFLQLVLEVDAVIVACEGWSPSPPAGGTALPGTQLCEGELDGLQSVPQHRYLSGLRRQRHTIDRELDQPCQMPSLQQHGQVFSLQRKGISSGGEFSRWLVSFKVCLMGSWSR